MPALRRTLRRTAHERDKFSICDINKVGIIVMNLGGKLFTLSQTLRAC